VAALTAAGLPNVQAAGTIATDLDNGTVYFERNADAQRGIASTGKIFLAMVVRERDIDLEALTEITEEDRLHARGGAPSRLMVGHRFRNIDLLRAMLIASDNRACTALGRAVGLSPERLVAAMNAKARALGLRRTRFVDPSGLAGNLSTAREMLAAFRAALADPLLAEIMGTADADVLSVPATPDRPAHRVHYRNTNRALFYYRFPVYAGKTGYTDEALYCLLIAARLAQRDVGIVLLGAYGKLTRWGDFQRIAQWMNDGGHLRAGASAQRTSAAMPAP
jgi:D-alanyl-D-alanine endopeptidase (penicillin-binding protein 7)